MILAGLDIALGGYLVTRCLRPSWRRAQKAQAVKTPAPPAEPTLRRLKSWAGRNKRYAPALAIGAGVAALFVFGLDRYLGLETLQANLANLRASAMQNTALTALGFLGAFTAFATVGILGVEPLIILGGLLFGTWLGGALCVLGITIAGSAVFLSTRLLISDQPGGGPKLSGRFARTIEKMREGYRRSGGRYLLTLRLMPMMPFWLIHVGSAVLGVPFWEFVLETLVGAIPATLLFTAIGASLAAVLDSGRPLNAELLASPEVAGPVALMTALWLGLTLLQTAARRRTPLGLPAPASHGAPRLEAAKHE